MAGAWIDIAASDGGTFRGYLAVPAAGSGPGILLLQEIFGVNASMREVADLYAEVVANTAPFDFVLLGVGEDGHVNSLFPGHKALQAEGLTAGIHDSPKPPPRRVTMTLEAIRDAGRILIIATGEGKANAVALARRGETPSGMIAGARWLIDRAAAGR